MKVAALRRTVDKIEKTVENPACVFDMTTWVKSVMRDGSNYEPYWDKEKPCGTAACFAGWAVSERVRELYAKGAVDIEEEAAKVLGLERFGRDLLFDAENWPQKFVDAYYAAREHASRFNLGTKRRIAAEKKKVNVLRARVEHFIATKGEE